MQKSLYCQPIKPELWLSQLLFVQVSCFACICFFAVCK